MKLTETKNTFILNFGESAKEQPSCKKDSCFNIIDQFANGESLWEVYYEIKHKIVSYEKESKLKISSPYVDFSGAGEILTIGYPIIDKSGVVQGAAAIDTSILTHGVRNGPYL